VRYNTLGNSGLRVSQMWLGTMTFGEDWGWGSPEPVCGRIVDAFLDAGGNVIDTADVYTDGTSEEILGRLLGARRERVILSTKFSLTVRPDDPNGGGSHRRRLVQALESSLRRLRTDFIDLLWVHIRDDFTPIEETMRALDDQVRLGKVLYVGVSDWRAWEIARANTLAELRGWSPFAAVQAKYSLLDRTPERDLIPMANSLGMNMVAWGPLASGKLTGKYLEPGATGRIAKNAGQPPDAREQHVIGETVAIAGEVGAQPSQVALAWMLARPEPIIPLIGATDERQLAQNLGAAEVELQAEHIQRLDTAGAIDLGFPHDFLASDTMTRVLHGNIAPSDIHQTR
jgi:aryl-alcohol dehydrogenase-like predicted oxidoreductase